MLTVARRLNQGTAIHRRRRNQILQLVGGFSAASVLISVAGCEAIPSPGQINQQFTAIEAVIFRAYQQMLTDCEQLPEPTKSECKMLAIEWYGLRMAEAQAAKTAAHEERWQDAYDRRKALEEKLREMLPDFPDIRDITEPLFNGAIVTIDLEIAPQQSSSSSSAQAAEPAPPCEAVLVTGWGSLTAGSFDALATISGSLCLSGANGPGKSYTGTVQSGQIVAPMNFGQTLTLTVVSDPANEIVTNPAGQGQVTVLFTSSYSQVGWNAILPTYTRYQLQVLRDAQGVFHIEGGPIEAWRLQGHTPIACSDYDLNGTLDYAPDSTAFLLGWAANDLRADMNVDGLWDAADVQLWEDYFWLDILRQ